MLHVAEDWCAFLYVLLETLTVPESIISAINGLLEWNSEWNSAKTYVPIITSSVPVYVDVILVHEATKRSQPRFSGLIPVSYIFVAQFKSALALNRARSPFGCLTLVLLKYPSPVK